MVGREVLGSFFIMDDDIKFLKEENPPEQSRLNILLIQKTAPIAKSLASHMSSNGKSQSGVTNIGASVNLFQEDGSSARLFSRMNKSMIKPGVTKKTPNSFDGGGMR
ncbi:hypothetical protein Tco_0390742 [Tanacetum coccineum]